MHKYFLKTPWWVRKIYSSYNWKMPATGNCIYLTFDDGPHPTITPWVLQELKKYEALATFFCIGKNVAQYPEVYQQILAAGHAVGNHTFSHLNGWKTPDADYVADAVRASNYIQSDLFRPPYGRIRKRQAKGIKAALKNEDLKIIMWDVLSADFDASITAENCAAIVLKHTEPGSIIVFHDSEKAFRNLQQVLPQVLERISEKKYVFSRL